MKRKTIGLALFSAVIIATGSSLALEVASTQPTTQVSAMTDADLRAAYSVPPDQWPAAHWLPGVEQAEIGLVPPMVHPESNPYSKEKAELGRKLFWDVRLSGSMGVACVSCHHPDLGWSDGKAASQGHRLQKTSRNSPTLLGVGYRKVLMWDGRADTLEAQALLPLGNDKEMHADFSEVEKRINAVAGYRDAFKAVFGVETITVNEVAMALATFQRMLVPGRSKFDAFAKGRPEVLSDSELRGLHLFRTAANCINCHSGPSFTDDKFHNLGLSFYGKKFEDLGRYNQTKNPADVGAFKTPTLRNVSRTAPYMHHGFFEMDGVINLYNAGGGQPKPTPDQVGDPLFPKIDPLLHKLNLSKQDKADLIAFLNTLEELRVRVTEPELPQ